MGLGNLIKDVLTVGGTARRRNKRAKRERREARDMIAQNTATAQSMFDRDLGQSAFGQVYADPRAVMAQEQALGRMQQVANEGYTDVDRQAMQQQLNDAARYEQSQRQSLAADARARGVSGSGMDIMSQLAAQQAGADRATQTAADMAIAGRDRSYQANADAANLAGGIRQQGFGEQATIAGAQDQYGQWRIGQQSSDAAALMAARQGNADMLNASAQQREQAFNEGVDQAVQVGGAIANAYTGGVGGAAAGAATGGAKSMPSGAPQQKAMPGTPPSPAAPAAPQQKMMPGAAAAPRPGGNAPAVNAIANVFGGGAARPPQRAARLPNARRRGGLLLGGQ